MAYVPVPNDLSRIKTKLAFNLTKRQLICFSIAGGIGVPFYLFTRSHIGNSTALFLMIGLMMPCFLFALPRVRPYKTENFYAILNRKEEPPIADQHRGKSGRRKRKAS